MNTIILAITDDFIFMLILLFCALGAIVCFINIFKLYSVTWKDIIILIIKKFKGENIE
jgi:TctA family transporter